MNLKLFHFFASSVWLFAGLPGVSVAQEDQGLVSDRIQWNSQIRGVWTSNQSHSDPSMSLFAALANSAASSGNNFALEAQVHASLPALNGIFTVQTKSDGSGQGASHAWVNELSVNLGSAEWQLTLGRKILAWDVS